MTGTTVLAFDYGARRIGVAVGQTVTGTASPLGVVAVRNRRPDWGAIAKLVGDWGPEALVVGLPVNMDGSPHELEPAVLRFRRQLAGRFRLPVDTVDERLSSFEAARRRRGAPGSEAALDAVAAQVILESWLDAHRETAQ